MSLTPALGQRQEDHIVEFQTSWGYGRSYLKFFFLQISKINLHPILSYRYFVLFAQPYRRNYFGGGIAVVFWEGDTLFRMNQNKAASISVVGTIPSQIAGNLEPTYLSASAISQLSHLLGTFSFLPLLSSVSIICPLSTSLGRWEDLIR